MDTENAREGGEAKAAMRASEVNSGGALHTIDANNSNLTPPPQKRPYVINLRTFRNKRRRISEVLGRTARSRFKHSLYEAVEVFVKAVESQELDWWLKTDATSDEIGELRRTLLLKHTQFARLIDPNLGGEEKRGIGDGAIVGSFRELWDKVSTPEVVATEEGRRIRRSILGAICGESTTYVDAREFVGGTLSREAFHGAKTRREEAMEYEDLYRIVSDRQPRSDRLEIKCPKGVAWIQERITLHTQPSPCEVKWQHNYAPGNHTRSDADNSLVCVRPELCSRMPIRYLMGTKVQLYEVIMREMEEAFQTGAVEVPGISRIAFDDLIPFYVMEQSNRSCLCATCYKAKLVTIALYDLWPKLHRGLTPGSACTCDCDLCKDGGCVNYLPYDSRKSIHGMGNFSDKHMCNKEYLYTSHDGTRVEAHKSTCVGGSCVECTRMQRTFFGCPRHKAETWGEVSAGSDTNPSEGPAPGEIRWNMYTDVDENGMAKAAVRRRNHRREGGADDDDGEYDPRATSKPRKRQAIAEKRGSVDDFMYEFSDIFYRYIIHRRQYKMQRIAFNEKKLTVQDGEVLLVVDFQERLQVKEQDQVQSQHWNHDATTIFPCYIMFRWGGRVWAYSFVILSDDMAQDNAWVQHVLSKLLSEDIPALLREIGAVPMSHAIPFSDNCFKQFKCRFQFGWVGGAIIPVVDDRGVPTDKRVKIEHHYFGPSHGKNSSDSEGAVTKTYVRTMVNNQQWNVVSSSRDMCEKLEKGLGFLLREATDEERTTFFEARGGEGRGTEKICMTKTWIGEGRSTPQEKTFLLTKQANTLLGGRFLFVGKEDVTPAARKAARSAAKHIKVAGCQAIGRVAATETPGIVAVSQLSCFCKFCLDKHPESCPLIRRGIMSGPSEYRRDEVGGDDDDDVSAKEYDLRHFYKRLPDSLPYGSTALIRVDPAQHQGQDIVPVLIARKAPSPWTASSNAHDGMFTDGDIILWIVDLERAEETECVHYVVPNEIAADAKIRAIPLNCIAGLGQGLCGYMERVEMQGVEDTHFKLRDGVVANARSNLVLLSTNPSSAFRDFEAEPFSEDDIRRCPVRPKLFDIGTEVAKKFTGPYSPDGTRLWRVRKEFKAMIASVRTNRDSRRHQYRLDWKGDLADLLAAGAEWIVDEGYIEKYKA